MEIKQAMLTPNKWSRPTTKLKAVKAIVIHWVANPKTSAMANRNFFENRKHGKTGFGSAHFFIDLDGSFLQCLPVDEVGYHVGAKKYKDKALSNISSYPNDSSLGIEVTHEDWTGRFSPKVELATATLTAMLLKKYKLSINDVYRHYDITGKDCPKYYVEHTKEWERLLGLINEELNRSSRTPSPQRRNNPSIYTVVKGDTLFGISRKVGISVNSIKIYNNLKNDNIFSGQVLKLYPQSQSIPIPEPLIGENTNGSQTDIGTKNPIVGHSKAIPIQMSEFVKKKNPNFDSRIAEEFIKVGQIYGIRGDVAFAQSIIETGWFKFDDGTAVGSSQHNYCGLGVTSRGKEGNSFATIKDGVTAQIQHLFAYATNNKLPVGEEIIDPRFSLVTRGVAPNWEDLNNRWAMNDSYGQHIIKVYNDLLKTPIPKSESKQETTTERDKETKQTSGLAAWKQKEGEICLDRLKELGIVHDPTQWKSKLGESTENWLMFVITARMVDLLVEKFDQELAQIKNDSKKGNN